MLREYKEKGLLTTHTFELMVLEWTVFFQKENSNFDTQKFITACGYEPDPAFLNRKEDK